MEAKGKANELANKFISKSVFDMTDEQLIEERKLGKKYALICVNEILGNIEATKLYCKDNTALHFNEEYWNEVKDEINLL